MFFQGAIIAPEPRNWWQPLRSGPKQVQQRAADAGQADTHDWPRGVTDQGSGQARDWWR